MRTTARTGDLPHHLTAVTRWTGMDEETVVIVAVFSDNVGDAEEDTLIFFFLVLFGTSVLFLITNDGDLLLLVLDVLHGGFAGDASAPDSLPLFLGFCLSLPPTEVGGAETMVTSGVSLTPTGPLNDSTIRFSTEWGQ